jgi:hypothetical protein
MTYTKLEHTGDDSRPKLDVTTLNFNFKLESLSSGGEQTEQPTSFRSKQQNITCARFESVSFRRRSFTARATSASPDAT